MEKFKTFLPRLLALLIDSFIFLPLGIIDEWLNEAKVSQNILYFWLPLSYLAFPLYSIIMNGLYGQTLGKMALNVKVLDLSESAISFRQAILRDIPQLSFNIIFLVFSLLSPAILDENAPDTPLTYTVKTVYMLLMIWSFADIIVFFSNDKRRALHDYIAGTIVVKIIK